MSISPIYSAVGFDISKALAAAAQGSLGFLLTIDYDNMRVNALTWSALRFLLARLAIDFYKMRYSAGMSPLITAVSVLGVWSALTWYQSGMDEVKQHMLPTLAVMLAVEAGIERGMIPLPKL